MNINYKLLALVIGTMIGAISKAYQMYIDGNLIGIIAIIIMVIFILKDIPPVFERKVSR